MADDASIKFGAEISDLIDKVDQVHSQLESLTDRVAKIGEGFKALGELIGVSFSIESIKSFVESMAELGEQTVNLAGQLGIATAEVGQLNAVAALTGTSGDALGKTMSVLALNIEKAQKSTTPTALALKALGLNAQDLIGLPLPQLLDTLSVRFNNFADGLNKAAVADALVKSGAQSLLPTLQEMARSGSDVADMAERTGTALSEAAARGMEDTHTKIVELDLAFQGFGVKLFTLLKPAIDAVISGITSLLETADPKTMESWISTIANYVLSAVEVIGDFLVPVTAQMQTFGGFMDDLLKKAAQLGSIGSVLAQISGAQVKLFSGNVLGGATDLFNLATGGGGGAATTGSNSEAARATQEAWTNTMTNLKQQVQDLLASGLGALLGTGDAKSAASATKPQVPNLDVLVTQTATAVNAVQKEWNSLFTSIMGGFDKAITGLVTRTMSWRQAMFSVLGSIWQEFAKLVEQMIVKWAAGEAMKLAASQAAVIAETAATAAGQAAQSGLLGAQLIKQILASAQGVFAGIFSFLAPLLGPAAAGPAAAGAATVAAAAAAIPAFAEGAGNIPRTMLGLLHPGEMVVPQRFASMFRGLLDGGAGNVGVGGGDVHFHVNAIDASGVAAFFKNNGQHIASAIKGQARSFNPNVPTWRRPGR